MNCTGNTQTMLNDQFKSENGQKCSLFSKVKEDACKCFIWRQHKANKSALMEDHQNLKNIYY